MSTATINVVLDHDAVDFHIDASPDHPPRQMAAKLRELRELGYEPLDDDECEPELLDNGWVRIYLAIASPIPAQAPLGVRSSASTGLAFAGATSAPTALSSAAVAVQAVA